MDPKCNILHSRDIDLAFFHLVYEVIRDEQTPELDDIRSIWAW